MVHYTTSKFAVRGMAKAFATELAQAQRPGQQRAPDRRHHPDGHRRHAGRARQGDGPRTSGSAAMFMNMLPVEAHPAGRTSPTLVLFLASDESKIITAHELAPDAGVTEM